MLLLKRLKTKKIDWKKGGSELISFALVMPFFCFMILMMVNILQRGIIRQSVEHAAYMSARAAVTCETVSDARTNAINTAQSTLANNSFSVAPEDVQVTLSLVAGSTSTANQTNKDETSNITWEKGALAKCEIKVPFTSMTGQHDYISSVIFMMVEKPARTYG